MQWNWSSNRVSLKRKFQVLMDSLLNSPDLSRGTNTNTPQTRSMKPVLHSSQNWEQTQQKKKITGQSL
jgi:hypothetical protein